MERSNTNDFYDEDDEYLDISSCDPTYTKNNGIVSTKLCMAGGGSHAWWYVIEWKNGDDEPNVFITTLYKEKEHTNKTLIIRDDGSSCQSVKLVDFDSELPEENDYEYSRYCIGDMYDELEEECTDANRCEACTYCARTKVCGDCGCVGGCYSSCCGKDEDNPLCKDCEIETKKYCDICGGYGSSGDY